MAMESIFSGLNNVIKDDLMTTSLTEYYGFTELEVSKLFEGNAKLLPKVRKW